MDLAGNSGEADIAEDLVIPVLAEQLQVDTVAVPGGGVRIIKRVVEESVEINEQLQQHHADIQRVAIGRYVDGPQPVRQIEDGVIVPVVEEQLVVERRWLLKEELHIRQLVTSSAHKETVPVHHEEVTVERFDQ